MYYNNNNMNNNKNSFSEKLISLNETKKWKYCLKIPPFPRKSAADANDDHRSESFVWFAFFRGRVWLLWRSKMYDRYYCCSRFKLSVFRKYKEAITRNKQTWGKWENSDLWRGEKIQNVERKHKQFDSKFCRNFVVILRLHF